MSSKINYILSLLILLLTFSCSEKYLEDANQEYFTRLYRGPADIEAIDFIIKPNNEGFLVVGNSKSNDNTNSNIILFDLNSEGYIIKSIELNTSEKDEAQNIYLSSNNEVFLLGKRVKEDQIVTILAKTDLSANFNNYVDSLEYTEIRELKYKSDDDLTSYIINDFGIEGEKIILVGYLERNGRTNAIARSYDVNSLFLDFSNPIIHENQIPVASNLNFDNSSFKSIGLNEYTNYPISIYGQKINSKEEIDITTYLIDDINEFRFISPRISDKKNQSLKTYFLNSIDNSIIFVGNNASLSSAGDSIFVMRALYNPSLSSDSVGYNILSTQYWTDYGSEIVDITQKLNGDFLIATVSDSIINNDIISRTGYILKFSFLANSAPQTELTLTIAGNGFQNIKKLKYDKNTNITYILSGVTLGTEETAIELTKVMF